MNGLGSADTTEFEGAFARFRLDSSARRLYKLDHKLGKVWVRLCEPAFDLLCLLVGDGKDGKVVSKKELKNAAWGREDKDDDYLKVMIRNLRRSLGENEENSCIQNIRGRGYCYKAPPKPDTPPVPDDDNGRNGGNGPPSRSPSFTSVFAATVQLEAAVTAFRAALEELTR